MKILVVPSECTCYTSVVFYWVHRAMNTMGQFTAECETTGMRISTSKYEAKVLSKGHVNTCDVCRTADAVAEYESKPFDLLINLCSYPNKI